MNNYDFEATDFALSDAGIHLLRSRHNYKTIEYKDIDKAIIIKTSEIKNGMFCLLLGIALVSFSIYEVVFVTKIFSNSDVHVIFIESILLPFFPGVVGIYLLYIFVKKGLVLTIESGNSKQKLRLRDFVKNNNLDKVKLYLKEKLSYRLSITDNV